MYLYLTQPSLQDRTWELLKPSTKLRRRPPAPGPTTTNAGDRFRGVLPGVQGLCMPRATLSNGRPPPTLIPDLIVLVSPLSVTEMY